MCLTTCLSARTRRGAPLAEKVVLFFIIANLHCLITLARYTGWAFISVRAMTARYLLKACNGAVSTAEKCSVGMQHGTDGTGAKD